MATTTNYGWDTPDDTDLVKDGAAAIRTLGSSIDTTTKNLNPQTTTGALAYRSATANVNTALPIGTANQVLRVNSGGTAPEWATTADQTPLTTKGDLFGFDTADARIPIGTDGHILTADSTQSLGLKWAAAASSAVNKNYLINGGFAISQRGTSFTSTGGANNDDAYTLDRWYILSDTNDVIDVTQNTSTVPTNGQFAIALDVETVNKKFGIATIIENKDCVGLIGNTVTFSFKAKVSATTKLDNVKAAIVAWSGTADTVTSDIISAWNVEGTNPTLIANATYENSPVNLNLTTSYATYSVSAAVDTASTKNIILFIWSDVTDTTLGDFLYIAESKLELGSSATAFQYAGGTLGGELAACQRYFWRLNGNASVTSALGMGRAENTTKITFYVENPVEMRVRATSIEANLAPAADPGVAAYSITTSISNDGHSTKVSGIDGTASGFTTSRMYFFRLNADPLAYFGCNAEL